MERRLAASGCEWTPNTDPCDADGNGCTAGDQCADGSCKAGDDVICEDDGEPCTEPTCGAERDCGWIRSAVMPCAPGVPLEIGCGSGAGCGLGTSTGDPMVRVCGGVENDFLERAHHWCFWG